METPKLFLPVELWTIILKFVNLNDIRNIVWIAHLDKNKVLVEIAKHSYKQHLYFVHPLLFTIFNIYSNINNINNRLDYINYKAEIYQLSVTIDYHSKKLCYNAYQHWSKSIKSNENKTKFFNICKLVLVFHTLQTLNMERKHTLNYF